MTGPRARLRMLRLRLAYRVRTAWRWYLCTRWYAHAWTPWERCGWATHYRDDSRVFEGFVYSRRCTWCGRIATKDALSTD